MGTRIDMLLVENISKFSARILEEQGIRMSRVHVYPLETHKEKVVFKEERLAKEGFISKAARTNITCDLCNITCDLCNSTQLAQ